MIRPAGIVLAVVLTATPAAGGAHALLWQTNAWGDDIHLIDPNDLRVVERIVVGPHPHGIAVPRIADTVFVTLERNGEARGELLWIDAASLRVRHRIRVGPEPHQIAVTPDGRWVYVPCRDGSYWVVDAERKAVVKRIHTGGRPHNTTVSPDGRFVFLSPMGEAGTVTIVEVGAGHRVVGRIPFADSVRPPAISADGTRFFQHVDGLNGFQVADVASRRVVATARHGTTLGWLQLRPVRLGWLGPDGLARCHGLAVRPNRADIWSVCARFAAIHALDDAGYPERAVIELPAKGYWLTFSPDGRLAFIALSEVDAVAVVDASRRRLVGRVAVGRGPKRNLVIRSAR
ncbi:MAG: cytochrome D1 domain-containing protein [Myxococcota bacterium]